MCDLDSGSVGYDWHESHRPCQGYFSLVNGKDWLIIDNDILISYSSIEFVANFLYKKSKEIIHGTFNYGSISIIKQNDKLTFSIKDNATIQEIQIYNEFMRRIELSIYE